MRKRFLVCVLIMLVGLVACNGKEESTQKQMEMRNTIETVAEIEDDSDKESTEMLAAETEEGKEYYATAALNIRTDPDITSDILDVLSLNDKVIVFESTNGWARIKYENMDAYISEAYLSETPVEIAEPANIEEVNESTISDEEVEQEMVEVSAPTGNMSLDILNLLNAYRQENGFPALTMTESLNGVAQIRACEASQYWSHTRPDGRELVTVFQEAGIYGNCAENLAYGCTSAEEFMEGWKASSSHNATMLNGNYTKVGIAIYQDSFGRIYAAQEFQG